MNTEILVIKKPVEWRKEKCVSCKVGFNSRSNPVKCDGCDKYTHKKISCLKETQENSQFLCQLCAPNTEYPHEKETLIIKVENGFKCTRCSLIVKTKYSIMRHVIRVHGDQEVSGETDARIDNSKQTKKKNLVDVLKSINLMQYNEVGLS